MKVFNIHEQALPPHIAKRVIEEAERQKWRDYDRFLTNGRLIDAFQWDISKEKHNYWVDIYYEKISKRDLFLSNLKQLNEKDNVT